MIEWTNVLAQAGQQGPGPGGMAVGGAFMCVFALIMLAMFVIWLWALIDCVTREFPGNEKIVWVLVIIFLQVLGAIIYLIVGRSRGTKGPPASL